MFVVVSETVLSPNVQTAHSEAHRLMPDPPPPPQLGLRGRHGRQLGPDLLEAIFSRLSAKQLTAAELTCRHWCRNL